MFGSVTTFTAAAADARDPEADDLRGVVDAIAVSVLANRVEDEVEVVRVDDGRVVGVRVVGVRVDLEDFTFVA